MDRLRALEMFARIVEVGSFSAAARDLGVPPSTASTMIKDLEARIGAKLLERTTRRVSVTEEGRRYHERVSNALGDLAEADALVRAESSGIVGRVRIAAPRHLASAILVPALPELVARRPKLRIDFALTDKAVDMVEEGVDVSLRIGPLADSGAITRRLATFPRVTCAAPRFLETHGRVKHPRDLERDTAIGYRFPGRSEGYPWVFRVDGSDFEFTPNARVTFDDLDAYIDAASHGMGVAQVLWFQSIEAVRRGRLEPILQDFTGDGVSVSSLIPNRRHVPARTRVVLDWVATTMRDAEREAARGV